MEDAINISNEFNIYLEEIYEGEINLNREIIDSSIEVIGLTTLSIMVRKENYYLE